MSRALGVALSVVSLTLAAPLAATAETATGADEIPASTSTGTGTGTGTGTSTSTLAQPAPLTVDRVIRDRRLGRASGLAASTYARPTVFTHNDLGDGPVIYAVGARGRTQSVIRLKGARSHNWADLAAGPRHSLWVGDIGDAATTRRRVEVYRVREPRRLRSHLALPTQRFVLTYPDGPHDAATLLVNPRTGRLSVVDRDAESGSVYRAPARLSTRHANRLVKVATAPAGVMGGSFSPDGRRYLLATDSTVYVYGTGGTVLTTVPLPDHLSPVAVSLAGAGATALAAGRRATPATVYR
ncbi:MAG: hypothetical protein WB441_02360, partial [Nocardioidaceae bacterium]